MAGIPEWSRVLNEGEVIKMILRFPSDVTLTSAKIEAIKVAAEYLTDVDFTYQGGMYEVEVYHLMSVATKKGDKEPQGHP